jgi:Putative transposase
LREAFRQRRLGALASLATEPAFRAFLRSLYRQAWMIYAKPPFGSPAYVLQYLARYTHRVAISNHRLVAITDDTVTFRWKDYQHGDQIRTLTVDIDDFLQRFLLHVLPPRFVRIRYFGFLASRTRGRRFAQCRQALAADPTPPSPEAPLAPPAARTWPCPRCGGPMRVVERLTARQLLIATFIDGLAYDTS